MFGIATDYKLGATSPLNAMSQTYRLSRLTRLHAPEDFDAFVVAPVVAPASNLTTACLWFHHADIDEFVAWAELWSGTVATFLI